LFVTRIGPSVAQTGSVGGSPGAERPDARQPCRASGCARGLVALGVQAHKPVRHDLVRALRTTRSRGAPRSWRRRRPPGSTCSMATRTLSFARSSWASPRTRCNP